MRTPAAVSLLAGLATAGLAVAPRPAAAQTDVVKLPPKPVTPDILPYAIAGSQVRALPRAANGRDYQIFVGLPASYYSQPAKRYPVLYFCDGYWDFTLLHAMYGGLLYDKEIPEIILVGFGYPGANPDFGALRQYDYTPVPLPNDAKAKVSGHGGEFLRVVETEIIPFVEREYRVDPSFRALGGSSLGGLFTLFALFERPGLFQGYIAPSPAVEWANDWLIGREAAFAAGHKQLGARLFVTGASEEWPHFLASTKRFDAQLATRHYDGLQYRFRLIDGERHSGTKPESYNRGLRFVFAPLAPSPNDK